MTINLENKKFKGNECSSVAEYLLTMCDALGSMPSKKGKKIH